MLTLLLWALVAQTDPQPSVRCPTGGPPFGEEGRISIPMACCPSISGLFVDGRGRPNDRGNLICYREQT